MTFDPSAFLDEVATQLALDAPDDVKGTIFMDDRLQGEILSFQGVARDGLWSVVKKEKTPDALLADLKSAKTRIVAAAPSHAFTIERLVARAVERIDAKAREIGV